MELLVAKKVAMRLFATRRCIQESICTAYGLDAIQYPIYQFIQLVRSRHQNGPFVMKSAVQMASAVCFTFETCEFYSSVIYDLRPFVRDQHAAQCRCRLHRSEECWCSFVSIQIQDVGIVPRNPEEFSRRGCGLMTNSRTPRKPMFFVFRKFCAHDIHVGLTSLMIPGHFPVASLPKSIATLEQCVRFALLQTPPLSFMCKFTTSSNGMPNDYCITQKPSQTCSEGYIFLLLYATVVFLCILGEY